MGLQVLNAYLLDAGLEPREDGPLEPLPPLRLV